MGSKFKPWQNKAPKNRSKVARGMIEAGTGKGGAMRDRRERRPKERADLKDLQVEESFYDDQDQD